MSGGESSLARAVFEKALVSNVPPTLLNRHGIFFELGPGSYPVQHALSHEPWWLFNNHGELGGEGLLRPQRSNAGVYQLQFQTGGNESTSMLDAPLPSIPDGFYAGRQFVFPAMPDAVPFLCRVPLLLEPALTRLLNRNAASALNEPRLWIKIPMPPGIPSLHHAIGGVVLHATWEGSATSNAAGVTLSADERRRRETGLDVVQRILHWKRGASQGLPDEEDVAAVRVDALTLTEAETKFEDFKPETCSHGRRMYCLEIK